MPQVEQIGIDEMPVADGFIGTLDKPWGSGILKVIPLGTGLLFTAHDLTAYERIGLTEFTDECACICSMSSACVRAVPGDLIETPLPEDNVLGFSLEKHEMTFDLEPWDPYRSATLIVLPGVMADIGDSYPGGFEQLRRDVESIDWDEEGIGMCGLLHSMASMNWKSPGWKLMLRSRSLEMLSLILDAASGHREAMRRANTGSQRELVAQAQRIIRSNLDSRLTIDGIASKLYVSRSMLCGAFKTETGKSVGEFARELRLERAKEMLADGSLNVQEIARALGYPRQSSFGTMFKTATGMTPSAWRTMRAG